jgi:lipid A 3-O-deacylase
MTPRRMGCVLVVLLEWVLLGFAQQTSIRKDATEFGVWAGGGTGIGHNTSFQYANAGVRIGRVLTEQHGPGFLRGNFEYAADVAPLYLFFHDQTVVRADGTTGTQRQIVYGAEISPVVLKWNFTSGRKIVPFAALQESAIFTTRDVPEPATSTINFGSAINGGVQLFRDERHTLSFSGELLHISNAGIGHLNPGINLNLQFRIGYEWWR